jgi:hypothetical protein
LVHIIGGPSAATIAIAVVIPVLVLGLAALLGTWWYRRHRTQKGRGEVLLGGGDSVGGQMQPAGAAVVLSGLYPMKGKGAAVEWRDAEKGVSTDLQNRNDQGLRDAAAPGQEGGQSMVSFGRRCERIGWCGHA